MGRKINYWLLMEHLYYLTSEICQLLHVDESTVRNWVKKGMKVVRKRPRLMKGKDVKDFLRAEAQKSKCKLEGNQFYCVKCRTGVTPEIETIHIEYIGKNLGKYKACWIKAACPVCGTATRRFSSSRIAKIWKEKGWVL